MALYLYRMMLTGIDGEADVKNTTELASENLAFLQEQMEKLDVILKVSSMHSDEYLLKHDIYEVTPQGLRRIQHAIFHHIHEVVQRTEDLQ